MERVFVLMIGAFSLTSGSAGAQDTRRQAVMTGGGTSDRGKCTVEIVVDGAVEVEVSGNSARLRNLSGQPAQWRRFECTSAVPSNPANFHFSGVDGRGRQDLTRDPRNGGVAVIRIEDRDGGREGYTFDLEWGGYSQGGGARDSGAPGRDQRDRDYGDDRYRPDSRETDYYRRNGHGFAVDEAVRVCQDAVARQARSRFRRAEVHFRYTNIDDGPGRQDWVIGSIDVHNPGRTERFDFSCSVDFNTGRVRSARLEPRNGRR